MENTRIVALESENIKRLKAVRITPEGNMVVLTGNNGAGKSSVLDSIEYVLGGAKALPSEPLRHGADKGHVVLETESLVVKRTFTKSGGGELIVRDRKNGLEKRSPQSILSALISDLSFDPLEFTRMDSKQQRETIAKIAGVDLMAIDVERRELYDNRTSVGRTVKLLEGKLNGLEYNEQYADVEEVDTVKLMEEMNELNRKKNSKQSVNGELSMISDQITSLIREKKLLEERIKEIDGEVKAKEDKGKELMQELQEMETVDTSEIEAKLSSASEINRIVSDNEAYKETEAELYDAKQSYDSFTEQIETLDSNTKELIENANMPISGLQMSDNGVMYNGIPFEQCSQAEQIKISVAMGCALGNELRIMLIRDGSLLDNTSMAVLSAMAEEYNMQVWLERVGVGDSGIIIEDGEVKNG